MVYTQTYLLKVCSSKCKWQLEFRIMKISQPQNIERIITKIR